MKIKIWLLIFLLFPLIGWSQNYDPYKTNDEKVNSYYREVDSITRNIKNNENFDNLKYSYKYVDSINNYKNVITTNYWTNNIKVNFVFDEDNLSYIRPKVFDTFRRNFYQNKKLNVLIYLDKEEFKEDFFTTTFSDDRITYFKTSDYISTTIFFKDLDRFLTLEFYFLEGKLIKAKIRELNTQFQWDKINYTELYFRNSEIVFRKFYQSLMDGRFALEKKFTEIELIKISLEVLQNI